MTRPLYIVATRRPWNVEVYRRTISRFPGRWRLISADGQLTPELVERLKPRYIFFPHWSVHVPHEITAAVECVCFHETDVPFGRGGSPIQNLINRGYRRTVISALRMTEGLDAGPVYMKRPLSLEGRAEEIYIRAARTIAGMIKEIVSKQPHPLPQKGRPVMFKRRTPGQSRINTGVKGLSRLYDHLRMLDAPEYPRAFFEHAGFRYEFSRPVLRAGKIEANVTIISSGTPAAKTGGGR